MLQNKPLPFLFLSDMLYKNYCLSAKRVWIRSAI